MNIYQDNKCALIPSPKLTAFYFYLFSEINNKSVRLMAQRRCEKAQKNNFNLMIFPKMPPKSDD
jgi:hypothetical protein